MLWGDRLIRHDLRICDKTSVVMIHKDKVYLSFGTLIIVTSDYDDFLRRYCLLSFHQKEEVIESLLSGDNDLHQPIVKAFDAYNRVTMSFGNDYTDTTSGSGTST
ncbi:unnamed protein product [Heligmosomoides polygyrus]|uniref:Transposase n=1 Tax=Heligmosomoides polygyrus TaxID=6339 RepID=A0A183FMK2_HELPZ|nr:unnamed protein product [Heligmosomoides polygyrus]